MNFGKKLDIFYLFCSKEGKNLPDNISVGRTNMNKAIITLVFSLVFFGCSAPKKPLTKEFSDLFPPTSTNIEFVTSGVFSFDFNGDTWYAYVSHDGSIYYDKAPNFEE